MKSPLLGGFYIGRSTNLADNRCVNLFPELVETKDGKDVGALYGCPGYDLLGAIGAGPIRGAYFASNGILYVVSGNTLYSVSNAWTGTALGTITSSGGPVNMVDNGRQLLLVDGRGAWCLVFASGDFTNPVATLDIQTLALCYQDGFAVLNVVGTNQFYQSNLNDFTVFQALNYSSADSTPDQIIALFDLHREVWVFKQQKIEVWINAGLPGFAFQRLQGVQIPQGCAAPYSLARLGDSIVWLGSDEQGQGVVYLSEGYRAVRISTHAIEKAIAGYGGIADAIGYAYQDEGHYFYMLTFPTGNQTFCFDLTTRMWHERAAFSNGAFGRHASNCHAFAYGKHVIGDYQSGKLYAFNSNTYTDAGATRKWLRSWRAFPPNQKLFRPMRFNALEIDCQTGIDIPDGSNPQFVLRWSDDGGHTWSNELFEGGNAPGDTASRILFRRLGMTRRTTGFDRMFELSGTDPVPIALIGADVDVEPA